MSSSWRQTKSVFHFHSAEDGAAAHEVSTLKVAAFDMDSTLISTASGRKFPCNRKDWVWWDASVPSRLRELHQQGFLLSIFTNQKGLKVGGAKAEAILGKIEDLASTLRIPLHAYVASSDDEFRKPHSGMWCLLQEHHSSIPVDLSQSFYVGDAAGRPAAWDGNIKTPKDFSDADKLFAQAIGLRFFTPEEFFLANSHAAAALPAAPESFVASTINVDDLLGMPAAQPELILMVGCPASGKSTVARRFLTAGYVVVNQDTLKSRGRCVRETNKMLASGHSVVVDNTNPSVDVRKLYIDAANKHGVSVRCVWMQTEVAVARKLNKYRSQQSGGPKAVPAIAFHMFASKFHSPTEIEGFVSVHTIPFVPLNTEVAQLLQL